MPRVQKSAPLVRVYSGKGASRRSAQSVIECLERHMTLEVTELREAEICSGTWKEDALMLVMPGGADLPYCEVLNGQGNGHIKEFVTQGGIYLGLCAGAYYACRQVVFEEGTKMEVVGDRELGLFPGVAWGSVAPGFDYHTEKGAQAVRLLYQKASPAMPSTSASASRSVDMLGRVDRASVKNASKQPAATRCAPDAHKHEVRSDVGVTSTLAHQLAAPATTRNCWSACQQQEEPSARSRADESNTCSAVLREDVWDATPGRAVDFRVREEPPHGEDGDSALSGRGSEQEGPYSGRGVVDYVNGGPCFLVHNDWRAAAYHHRLRVLARYAATGRIAAVKCGCGEGSAVLCGSHPELDPSWLVQEGWVDASAEVLGVEEGERDAYVAHVQALIAALAQNQTERELFFRELLIHAGLERHLRHH